MSKSKKPIDTNEIMDELTDMSFFQKPVVQDEAGKQENMQTSLQENVQTRKPVNKASANYPKVTYQLDPEVIDLLDDAKRTLKKQHKLKVSLNAIVEEAIRMACEDLEENKEASKLVNLFARKQENK